MNYRGHVSLDRAARLTHGYPLLLQAIINRLGLETESRGRHTFLREEDLPAIRQAVEEWRNRPRLTRCATSQVG